MDLRAVWLYRCFSILDAVDLPCISELPSSFLPPPAPAGLCSLKSPSDSLSISFLSVGLPPLTAQVRPCSILAVFIAGCIN